MRLFDLVLLSNLAFFLFFFFFNDTATTEIYTLSLHDALPIFYVRWLGACWQRRDHLGDTALPDRKSTRLNSSHSQISYAVFCLKKKSTHKEPSNMTYFVTHVAMASDSLLTMRILLPSEVVTSS